MSDKPKYLYWMTNRGAYRSDGRVLGTGNVMSPNSSCVFNMTFADLPVAQAYILKLEQFGIANTATGNVFDVPGRGALTNGVQCAVGMIEFDGFNPINGSLYSTSGTAVPAAPGGQRGSVTPARRRCILSRFDTSFMSTGDKADTSVAPPTCPSVLVNRPADGDYTFWIRGILNPYGQLCIDNGAAARRQNIGDWSACISLEPMTDLDVDKYYNINQPGNMSGLRNETFSNNKSCGC